MARQRPKQHKGESESHATGSSASRLPELIVVGLIVAVCVIVFYRVAGFDFINLDDDKYVYENAMVASGITAKSIAWAFTTFHAANWHPITWLSHQLDASLFGSEAGGHHLVNVAIHTANSLLLFFLIRRVTGALWKSAIVAAAFAIHPAHVESVAWIAERKDVLSTLFWLLSSIAYIRFAADTDDKRAYWASLLLFALGLMAKPMLVTFPFALLLLDYWPLRRISALRWGTLRPLIFEKLPFFALTVASAIVTVVAQKAGGAVQSLELFSLQDRLLNALVSYGKYVVMLFYPANLGIWYPFETRFSALQIVGSGILLVGVSAVAIWQIRQRPYLFVGWFWFLGTLVPVIGLVQVGRQALADRYTYIPYIGLSIAVIWLAADVAKRFSLPKVAVRAASVTVVAALAVVAFGQVSYWKNSETLYTRTLAVTPGNYLVEANYCRYLEKLGRLDDAVKHCDAAIEKDSRGVEALNTLGAIQLKQGKFDDARRNLLRVTEINGDYSLAYANLAIVEAKLQNAKDALSYYEQAIARDNGGYFDARRRAEAFSSIGALALSQRQFEVAGRAYEQALDAAPDDPDFQRNLANAYRSQGRVPDAIRLLESIIQKNPNSAEAHNSLGIVYAEQGKKQEAIAQFQRALAINPSFTQAQSNLRRAME